VIAATDKDVAAANEIFDEETQYGPHLVVVGAGQLVAGFEEDLMGKDIGYSGRVEVPPKRPSEAMIPRRLRSFPSLDLRKKSQCQECAWAWRARWEWSPG